MAKNKRLLVFGLAMIVAACSTASAIAAAPATLWTRTYGGTLEDVAHCIKATADHGYIMAGFTDSYGSGGRDFYVLRLDRDGDVKWTRAYGGSGNDYARWLEPTLDGGYAIIGSTTSFGPGGQSFYFVKTDANGVPLWTRTYGGPADDLAWSVKQTADSGYVLLGHTKSFGAGDWDVYLVRTDKTGSTIWTKTWGGLNDDRAYSIILASDGTFVISGYTYSFGPGVRNLCIVKLDADGNLLWAKTYKGATGDDVCAVQETPDGGYIVVGGDTQTYGSANEDLLMVRTDSNGDSLWTRAYGGLNNDSGWGVLQPSDGGFVACGYSESFGAGQADIYLMRVADNGDSIWTATYGGAGIDYGWTAIQTYDKGLAIVGQTESFGAGASDVFLIKTAGGANPTILSIADIPNDQGRHVGISWQASEYDMFGSPTAIEGYSIWRRYDYATRCTSDIEPIPRVVADRPTYPPGDWQYVMTVPARGESIYGCAVTTLCDSISSGICWSSFFVSAMTDDPLLYFDSAPDSGYSVDNLSPVAPANLRMASPTLLMWDSSRDADFSYFTAYGSSTPALDSTVALLACTIGTTMDVSGMIYGYYHVTATDFAGNEGQASTVENASADVEYRDEAPSDFAMKPNRPNPFAVTTSISFDLPVDCAVSIAVFDTQGRQVRSLANRTYPAGRQSLIWAGDDENGNAVGSGVYFVRIEAGGFRAVSKMLLMR